MSQSPGTTARAGPKPGGAFGPSPRTRSPSLPRFCRATLLLLAGDQLTPRAPSSRPLRRVSRCAPRPRSSTRSVAPPFTTKTGKPHATFGRAIGLLHPAGSGSADRAPLSFNHDHFCRRERRPALRGIQARACQSASSFAANHLVEAEVLRAGCRVLLRRRLGSLDDAAAFDAERQPTCAGSQTVDNTFHRGPEAPGVARRVVVVKRRCAFGLGRKTLRGPRMSSVA